MKRFKITTKFIMTFFVLLCASIFLNINIYSDDSSIKNIDKLKQAYSNPKLLFAKDKDVYYERMIGKGVKHIYEFIKEKPYQINVLEISLDNPTIVLEAEKGKDRLFEGEKVASIAKRENKDGNIVIGAVNADFWGQNYITIGFLVDDNTIYKNPYANRSCFFIDDKGTPHIGYLSLSLEISSPDQTATINQINPSDLTDCPAALFTSRAYDNTPKDFQRFEVVLKQISERFIPNEKCELKVVEVKDNSSGNTQIKEGYFVLSIAPDKSEEFKSIVKNEQLILFAKTPEFSSPIVLAVGGCPRLLEDGKVNIPFDKEEIGKNFATDLHPRTAIGFNLETKKLWLFTVDGRQPSLSIGMNLTEVALYLQKLGATEAMNLDGGGSSTMWARGNIVNSPSDATGPRTVTNALLLIYKGSVGELSSIDFEPKNISVQKGSKIETVLFGFDENYNPANIPDGSYKWLESPLIKAEIHNNTIIAKDISDGTVFLKPINEKIRGCFSHINIREAQKISAGVERIILESGGNEKTPIQLIDENGIELFYSNDAVSITKSSDNFDYSFENGILQTTGVKKGKGALQIKSGKASLNLPIYTDMLTKTIIEDFEPNEIETAKFTISGNYYDKDKTKITAEKTNVKSGSGAIRLDYDMTKGGTTAIYIAINAAIETQPTKVTLWVYGDAGKGWLRSEITDKDGEAFIIDYTEGGKGILWNDEWKYIEIAESEIKPKWTNPKARLDYPIKINNIYLAQAKEADKGSGSIIIDSLSAVIPDIEK